VDAQTFTALKAKVDSITRPDPALLTYYVVTSVLGIVTFPALLPMYFHYHTLKYAFEDDGIAMSYGILFRREMHLTYARIQDIHLSQNIIQRWLGIGTVTVQTAGGGDGGDLEIVGTREFEAIRDYLYARLRGVRLGSGPTAAAALPANASASANANASSSAGANSTDALLAEIRDELKATATALAARKSSP
jgi:putative membrane protein